MIFRKIELHQTVFRPEDMPETTLPCVLIAGRSNCGKSALINRLLGRKDLARTGRTPGRTQGVRFFRVDGRFDVADTPGFGFARMGREAAALNSALLKALFAKARPAVALLLMDIRREPEGEERDLLGLLGRTAGGVYLCLTKCDKVSRNEIQRTIHRNAGMLEHPAERVIAVSATSGDGMSALIQIITQGVAYEPKTAKKTQAVPPAEEGPQAGPFPAPRR